MSATPRFGWLPRRPEIGERIGGWRVPEETKTRREEYALVMEAADALQPTMALDAAAGYKPQWHVLSYILADAGWRVAAVDHNEQSLRMPPHPGVDRTLGDIRKLPHEDGVFDLVVCVSTLEHLDEEASFAAAGELARVAAPGAALIATGDNYAALPELFFEDFDVGGFVPLSGQHLSPAVFYCIGRKRE